MSDDPLQQPVQFLRGAGPQRARLLAKLGLETVGDLLWYLPRDVLDLTEVSPVHSLRAGELASVRGTVVDIDGRETSAKGTLVAVLLDCDGEYVRGVWFNQPWMLKKFDFDAWVLFSGKPKRHAGRWEFNNPRVQWLEGDPGGHGGIVPRYPLTEGLRLDDLRRILRVAVDEFAPRVPEHLPDAFRKAHRLPRLPEALARVHFPSNMDDYEVGRRRLVFDDLLEFQLGLALRRRAWRKTNEAPRLETTAKIDARIRRLFPFDFTQGQLAAVREIAADLASGRAMHRLLQADVGAGKTVVAVYAMLVAIAAGYQAVLMAPTEVLANQHWRTLERSLAHSRVNRLLLTGQLTSAERRRALADVKSGAAQLIVGTQAVIQQDVEFHKLGVAVIDEQHKFGVVQRARFSSGAGGIGDPSERQTPHILVMTATPIPRSLCLTQFGDLDITLIRDLPPGRQKIVTSRVSDPEQRRRAWDFIRKQLRAGRQAFVICPRVEGEGDDAWPPLGADPRFGAGLPTPPDPKFGAGLPTPPPGDDLAESAEDVHRQLTAGELRDVPVGLIHGRLDHRQKDEAMYAFRTGETRALVATTVVEVGVDVPNATLMVVNQAHRFGLSQLHQLRGRIARGKFQGYCFLFSESTSPDAVRRLAALEETSDGFQIAEVDFELRGPGDVLGTRQHGELPLRVANIARDADALREARKAAFDLVESAEFDQPQFAPLKTRVLDRFGRVMDLPQTG